MSDDYNEQYWRNRGGEGKAPWVKEPNRVDEVFKAYDELAKEAAQEIPRVVPPKPSPLDSQVGGGHYKDMAIQPVEYITKNNLGFIEGCIIKYISRYQHKGGIEDLNKVIHFTELLKELKYGN